MHRGGLKGQSAPVICCIRYEFDGGDCVHLNAAAEDLLEQQEVRSAIHFAYTPNELWCF